MTAFDKARELATALLESEAGMAMNDARYIFDGNQEAQDLLFKYSNFRADLESRIQNGSLEDEEIDKQVQILDKMGAELNANQIVSDMVKAENDFNNYVKQVMNVFNATISGSDEEQSGCTGSCSTCGGCH